MEQRLSNLVNENFNEPVTALFRSCRTAQWWLPIGGRSRGSRRLIQVRRAFDDRADSHWSDARPWCRRIVQCCPDAESETSTRHAVSSCQLTVCIRGVSKRPCSRGVLLRQCSNQQQDPSRQLRLCRSSNNGSSPWAECSFERSSSFLCDTRPESSIGLEFESVHEHSLSHMLCPFGTVHHDSHLRICPCCPRWCG